MFDDKDVKVIVRGYRAYCLNKNHEMYDFFVPSAKYHMYLKDVYDLVDKDHTVLRVMREAKEYQVPYGIIKKYGKEEE